MIKRLQTLQDERGNLPVKVLIPGLSKKSFISGIKVSSNSGDDIRTTIDLVPKFDAKGCVTQLAGTNSIIHNVLTLQTLFVSFAEYIMKVKAILERFAQEKARGGFKGKNVEIVPHVKAEFTRLFEIAKDIQAKMKVLGDFNTNLKEVVKEPIREADYMVSFEHHIDMDLTDSEFAKLITTGIGEKTSTQRLGVFLDIIQKINAEISNRGHRIHALERRIEADPSSNEAQNAMLLKKKSERIIETMLKRRDYIVGRYTMLRNSLKETLGNMDSKVNRMLEEHKSFSQNLKGKERRCA